MDYFAGLDISIVETKLISALSTAMAQLSTRASRRRRRRLSPANPRKRQLVVASYSRRANDA
jgi:hypothetical protein